MTITNHVLQVDIVTSFSLNSKKYQLPRQNAIGTPFTTRVLFHLTTKISLTCSDTTDKDKSTLYFFINCSYEEVFKDGQTQEVNEIIYTGHHHNLSK